MNTVQEIIDTLNKFATQGEAEAQAAFAKANELRANGVSDRGSYGMANWYDGKAEGYRLAAKWLARDVLGQQV